MRELSGSLTEDERVLTDEVLVDVDMDSTNDVAVQLRLAKVTKTTAEKRIEVLQERMLELMDRDQNFAVLITDPLDGTPRVAAPVVGEDLSVNLDRLRDLAGQAAVDAVVTKKVTVAKWEHAIETGVIPVEVAAQCCSYTPRRPYVAFNKPS